MINLTGSNIGDGSCKADCLAMFELWIVYGVELLAFSRSSLFVLQILELELFGISTCEVLITLIP